MINYSSLVKLFQTTQYFYYADIMSLTKKSVALHLKKNLFCLVTSFVEFGKEVDNLKKDNDDDKEEGQ